MTNDEIHEFLEQAIGENSVMLFMKGTPDAPALRLLDADLGGAQRARRALRGDRHPARPAHPRGAVGDLGLADDPAAVRRRRAGRRLRHRHRDVRDRRAAPKLLGVEQPEDEEPASPEVELPAQSGPLQLENRLD